MSLVEHAKKEFKVLGWPGDCDMQSRICDNLIELLDTFAKQGHSGSSAPYLVNLFTQLASFNSISPLTGEDDEWTDVALDSGGQPLYQNKRDSEVFKDDSGSYWISGKIFKDKDGCTYTNCDSRVPVVFPWTKPKSQIIEVSD